jgi:hypothetical protein
MKIRVSNDLEARTVMLREIGTCATGTEHPPHHTDATAQTGAQENWEHKLTPISGGRAQCWVVKAEGRGAADVKNCLLKEGGEARHRPGVLPRTW